jgi:hypothetical protein
MIKPGDRNIRMLIHVARHLGDLREKVVFLDGCCQKAPVRTLLKLFNTAYFLLKGSGNKAQSDMVCPDRTPRYPLRSLDLTPPSADASPQKISFPTIF